MQKYLTLPSIAMAFALTTSAHAGHDGPRLNVPADKWLSVSEVIQKLKAQGYNVTEIEADDGAYEFDAINADGVRVEGHAHPATGQVLLGYDD